VKPGGKPVLIADLGPYEAANNLDGAKDETGAPDLVVNPYDLIMDGAGGLLVSASGMNAVVRISPAGQITPYAVFKARQNPLFPGIGGPEMDQVPTGIERGPDGAVYVSTLTGFPFPNGGARVYRLQDRNSDGDAMDDGEVTTYADGLTTATNLAFDKDGSLLVTEFSTNFLEQAPGRLVRVVNGKISATVAAPLISPTGVAVMNDGTVMVSQEFAGIVADAQSGARLAAAGGPPGGAPSGGITPPSTGDGGLLGQSGGAWMAYTGLLMLVAGLGVGAYVSVKR
jgi:glucose/arabinose dehydrogenase